MSASATPSGGNEALIGKAIEGGVALVGNIIASVSGGGGGGGGGGNQPTIVRQQRAFDIGAISFVGLFLVIGLILIFKK
jgi:hypothetical protein